MRYLILVLMLAVFIPIKGFANDIITEKSVVSYLKSAEKAVLRKDISSIMETIAPEATFTMYEEHNNKIIHYHFDKDSYKKMMLDSFQAYPKMKYYKVHKIRTSITPGGQSAFITYQIDSSVVVDGKVQNYVTDSKEDIIIRNGKIQLLKYESMMKY